VGIKCADLKNEFAPTICPWVSEDVKSCAISVSTVKPVWKVYNTDEKIQLATKTYLVISRLRHLLSAIFKYNRCTLL